MKQLASRLEYCKIRGELSHRFWASNLDRSFLRRNYTVLSQALLASNPRDSYLFKFLQESSAAWRIEGERTVLRATS